jgi:hypothetical protein
MIRSLVDAAAGVSPFPSNTSTSREWIRALAEIVPKLGTIQRRVNPARAAKRSMLASLCLKLGGKSNPFGREARVTDFPDPPVCPPRVEGAFVADCRRPLPFAAYLTNHSIEAPRAR